MEKNNMNEGLEGFDNTQTENNNSISSDAKKQIFNEYLNKFKGQNSLSSNGLEMVDNDQKRKDTIFGLYTRYKENRDVDDQYKPLMSRLSKHKGFNSQYNKRIKEINYRRGIQGDFNGSDETRDSFSEGLTGTADLSGLMSNFSANDSKIAKAGGFLDSALGAKGALGMAFDAATRYAATKSVTKSAIPAIATTAIDAISKMTGAPVGQALGFFGKAADNIDKGMKPNDAVLGAALDFGIDIGIVGIGSLMGPVGAVLGYLAAGQIDVSSLMDGASKAIGDWGLKAEQVSYARTRQALQAIGVMDLLGEKHVKDFDALIAKMEEMGITSTDLAIKAIENSGYATGIGMNEMGGYKGLGIGNPNSYGGRDDTGMHDQGGYGGLGIGNPGSYGGDNDLGNDDSDDGAGDQASL